MREPISRDSASPRELAEATRRLDHALELLEAACAARGSGVTGVTDEAAFRTLEDDRARLIAEIDAARAREGELEVAAAAASQALGRAAAEVRAALEEGDSDGDRGDGDGDGDSESDTGQASKPDGDGFNEEAA